MVFIKLKYGFFKRIIRGIPRKTNNMNLKNRGFYKININTHQKILKFVTSMKDEKETNRIEILQSLH